MKSEKFKIIGVLLIGIILGSSFVSSIIFFKQFKEKKVFKKEIPEIKISKEEISQILKKWPGGLKDITEEEIAKIKGKTEEQIREEFYKEKKECIDRFKITKPEELLSVDPIQARRYAICEAIKENNPQKCSLLKENPKLYKECLDISTLIVKIFFKVLKSKSCPENINNECKKIEHINPANCLAICRAIVFEDSSGCDEINYPSVEKAICFAISKKDLSFCKEIKNGETDDIQNCEDMYHIVRAAKENNLSYLNQIKLPVNFVIGKLFFNPNLSCQELLTPFNEEYCSQKFTLELLQRRLDILRELQNIENFLQRSSK